MNIKIKPVVRIDILDNGHCDLGCEYLENEITDNAFCILFVHYLEASASANFTFKRHKKCREAEVVG